MPSSERKAMFSSRTPFIKACGITRLEDALAACAAGFTAVGFVFATSPRQVDPEHARGIAACLPPSVLRIGVFLDHEEDEVREIADFCGLDLVQLHGRSLRLASLFGRIAIPSIRPRAPEDMDVLEEYREAFAVLVDSWDPRLPGGTGRMADLGLAAEAARKCRVILAGGLNPGNVARAVALVRPFGVDVSSGVERAPGIKDSGLLRDFAREARVALGALSPEPEAEGLPDMRCVRGGSADTVGTACTQDGCTHRGGKP